MKKKRSSSEFFSNVAMIGAGTMGHALALVHALAGAEVRLQDSNPEVLAQAPALIDAALITLIDAGSVDPAERETVVARISTVATLNEAVRDAELIVEAVVENIDVKRALFAEIDTAAPEHTVIASNTSYLDIFPLVPARRQPHTLIAHWYTPPYIIDLVDIAAGPETLPEVVDRVRGYYSGMGKRPVYFDKLIPGYIANRLQAAMSLEVHHLMDEAGVSAEAIDESIQYGLALRMALLGHLKKADFTGLDMIRRSLANKMYTPPPPSGHSKTLDKLLAAGRGGVNSGAGYYDYQGKSAAELFRARDRKLLRLKQAFDLIDGESD